MPAAEKSQPELVNHFLSVNGFNPTILEKSPTRASWSDLLNDRTAGRRTMRAILSKCQAEGRDLNAVERGAYDLLSTAVGNLTDEIDTRSANGNREGRRQFGSAHSPTTANAPHVEGMLSRDQRLSDTVQGYGGQNVGLGHLVRASITGDWQGLEEFKSSQSLNNGPSGGFMAPEFLSARVIDLARNASRVTQAGATTIPISGPTTFATVEQDPEAHWRSENEEIPESEMFLGSRTFVPQTLAALVRCSIELLEDAPNLSALIENAFSAQLGLELDKMCLVGNGVGKPLGLLETPGVNVINLDAALSLTGFASLSRAVEAVRNNNAEPGAFLLAARTAGEIDRMIDEDRQPLTPPPSVKERAMLVTNQIPINMAPGTASAIFTGQWEDYYIAMRTNLVIEATRVADTAFKKMQVLIRGYLRADGFAVRPNHFAVIKGIVPPT